MSLSIIFVILLVAMFILSYLTKRRFGVLGLALAAGAMLSDLWAEKLTPYVAESGVVNLQTPPLAVLVAVLIVILPAILLLFLGGPTYKSKLLRFVGSAAFAILALALVVGPLDGTLALDGVSQQIYDFVFDNRVWIVTAGLIYAIWDLVITRTPKGIKRKR
ncbi:MAG: hypothetical protein L0H36_01265 [bacterium]|nr:hypothetical protein [bacterium]MDN5835247.1 hypothetical protein [bacterium]